MPRKTKTILEREIESLPLGEMVLESLQVPGVSYRCARLAVDTVDAIVIVACGPAASVWLEIVSNYVQVMRLGEPTDEGTPTEQE